MAIRKRPAPVALIDAETLRFCVTGMAEDLFLEFGKSVEQWVAFGVEHGNLLRAEARRLGVAVPWLFIHYPRPQSGR
jgi:hypothetical protein